MKVRSLPRDPGPAGGEYSFAAPGCRDAFVGGYGGDWLVIGAGYAGLAAARRFMQLCSMLRVVVLDATRVGKGPAGRNSGFMIDLPHDLSSQNYGGTSGADLAQIAHSRRAIAFAAGMAQAYNFSEDAFTQSGKINGAATAKGDDQNRDFAAHLAGLDEP